MKVEQYKDEYGLTRIRIDMGMMQAVELMSILYKAKRYYEIMAKGDHSNFAHMITKCRAWIGIIRPVAPGEETDDSIMTRKQGIEALRGPH